MPRGRPSRLAVFDRLDRSVEELARVGGLPGPTDSEEIWEGIWYEEAHHSTAIEGNTLVLTEVRALLEQGRVVGRKELWQYLEVQGYAEAAAWVYQQARQAGESTEGELITLSELRELHRLTVEPAWSHFPPADYDADEGPGSIRRDVSPRITDWLGETQRMKAYAEDWLSSETELNDPLDHPIAWVADLHGSFKRISPFREGNGRTGRLALNLMLVRLGYPPAIIYKKDQAKYVRGLERADQDDPVPLGELLARAVTHGIDRFLLPALAGSHRMIPLSALADKELSLIALRRAAERGRLRAGRRSDQWYSTRNWVDEYKASRHRGRPFKRD